MKPQMWTNTPRGTAPIRRRLRCPNHHGGRREPRCCGLWREKRGEVEPQDLSGNLIVQLGAVTEELNRRWYEANTGQVITDVQKRVRHPGLRWMAATLDGRVEASGAVFEAKFMLPWSFSEEAAAEKYMPQLQHNMWVMAARHCGAFDHHRWRQVGRDQDPCRPALSAPHCHRRTEVLALCREWRAPYPVRGRATKTADRGGPDRRYELFQCMGGIRRDLLANPIGSSRTRASQGASSKTLVPEDAQQAIGHGVRAKRSKSGAVSFDLLDAEGGHAAIQ